MGKHDKEEIKLSWDADASDYTVAAYKRLKAENKQLEEKYDALKAYTKQELGTIERLQNENALLRAKVEELEKTILSAVTKLGWE